MPKNPNRSIRASQAFWDQLDAYAAKNKMRPGPAFVRLAELQMGESEEHANPLAISRLPPSARTPPNPKAVLRQAEASAAHLATAKPRVSSKQREWRSA